MDDHLLGWLASVGASTHEAMKDVRVCRCKGNGTPTDAEPSSSLCGLLAHDGDLAVGLDVSGLHFPDIVDAFHPQMGHQLLLGEELPSHVAAQELAVLHDEQRLR